MNTRLLIVIGGATVIFSVAVSVAVLWLLDSAEKSTRQASTQLAAALERNDADAAPEGAAGYVDGVRAYFGPVTSATVVDARNKSINTGDSADTRSFFVARILLRTERGAAVVEVEFDNHSLANRSQEVSAESYERSGEHHDAARAAQARVELDPPRRGGPPPADARLRAHRQDELRPAPVPGVPQGARDRARSGALGGDLAPSARILAGEPV